MKKNVLLILVGLLVGLSAYSKNVELTTTGVGATPQDAITNALKNSIEQAFGCFVSESVIIKDDEIAQDEIVTLSSGSIKKYKVIGNPVKGEDGNYTQVVQSIVSVEPLKVWATQHGISCELDGNHIVQQVKLNKVYAENAIKVQNHLALQIREMLKSAYKPTIKDLKATVSDNGDEFILSGQVWLEPTSVKSNIDDLIEKTLTAIAPKDVEGIKGQLTTFNVGKAVKKGSSYPVYMYSYTIFNGSKLTDGSLKDYLKDVFCGYYLIDNMGNKEWLGAAYTTLEWNSSMAKLNSLRYFDERGYVNYRGGNDKYHFWEKYNSNGHSKTEMGFVLSLYCIQGPIDLAYNERVGCQFELFYRMDEMEKFKELKIQKDEDSF